MQKKNITPIILLSLLLLSIVLAVIFKHWFFMFLASELVIFHLLPPFAVLLSILAFKLKLPFWYKQYNWEKSLFKKIKIKTWKNKSPTYDAKMFSLSNHSKDDILKLMIQSENVHLLLIFASYIPIILGKYYGHYPVLILLATIFSLSHIPFVMIQRFNIPRIIKLPS